MVSKHRRCTFKCSCMCFYSQRTTGVEVMSGTWKVHENIVSLIKPEGLHRILYEGEWDENSEDISFKKIKYRYNRNIRMF